VKTPHTAAGDAAGQRCSLCGKCLEVCPLVAVSGREELGPRAKFAMLEALAQGRLAPAPASDLARFCLSCGRCGRACPQGLEGGLAAARLRAAHPQWRSWLDRAGIRVLENPGLLGPAVWAASRLPGAPRSRALARGLAEAALPDPWIEVRPGRERDEEAVYFAGCAGALAGERDRRARLLVAMGHVLLPDPGFTCCGAPAAHAGLESDAGRQAGINLGAWRRAGRPLMYASCATCLQGLAGYADRDLGWEPGEARTWKANLRPLSRALQGLTVRVAGRVPPDLVYHRPCHMPEPDPDRRILEAAGVNFTQTSSACCGFGQVAALGEAELADDVGRACWQAVEAGPGTVVVTGCPACVAQLRSLAPEGARVGHWLELLRI
jgi:glycolate oxidase iron-sulfur subunit